MKTYNSSSGGSAIAGAGNDIATFVPNDAFLVPRAVVFEDVVIDRCSLSPGLTGNVRVFPDDRILPKKEKTNVQRCPMLKGVVHRRGWRYMLRLMGDSWAFWVGIEANLSLDL